MPSAVKYASAKSVSPLELNSHFYCDWRATDMPIRTEDKPDFLEFLSVGKKLRRGDEPDASARCRKDHKDNSYTLRTSSTKNRTFPA